MAQNKEKIFISTIENASILRKFTVLFLVMSILPVCVLYYFYVQFKSTGQLTITEQSFNTTLIFVAFGSLVGFFAMRSVLKKLIDLTTANTRVLQGFLSADKIKDLSSEKNEIAVLARSFSEIINRLEDNVKNLELAQQTLHSVLSKVGEGISSMQNIDKFLELILETVTNALNAKVSVLMLLDQQKNEIWVKSAYGMQFDRRDQPKFHLDEATTIGAVIRSKKPLLIPKMGNDFANRKEMRDIFSTPMICAPLVLGDKVMGVINVSGRKLEGNFVDEEIGLLFNLASQTAVAIENSRLNDDIETTYFETISALALAVDAKDTYSRGHLDRVAHYCLKIAYKMNLSNQEIKILRDAAKLHDVGKIGVPDEILKKPAPLVDAEREVMNKHPEIGESIIKPVRSLRHLCDIIRHHHEKLDGSGYPDGLKGDQITLLVRITTIADIYDALTTDRAYRARYSQEQAFHELRTMKSQLDQKLVEVFISAIS